VLSDENIKPIIEESVAYVLNRSLRKTVKSLIRLRERDLKSYKQKHQETRVALALDSLIVPILKKRAEKKMSVLEACLEVMMIDKDDKFRSAVDSIKVPQENELAQLVLESRGLKEQKRYYDLT
jgi:hypothetical protein